MKPRARKKERSSRKSSGIWLEQRSQTSRPRTRKRPASFWAPSESPSLARMFRQDGLDGSEKVLEQALKPLKIASLDDLYVAVGVHSGLACGAATDMPSAFAAMRQGGGRKAVSGGDPGVPAIIFHGDSDTTVHPSNSGQVLEQTIGTTSTQKKVHRGQIPGGHAYTRTTHTDAGGREILEHWNIHGAGHAWSGGSPAGSYTDPQGPDATREMLRFFLAHSLSH